MSFDFGKMLAGFGKSGGGSAGGSPMGLRSTFKAQDMSGKLSMLGDVWGGNTEGLMARIGGGAAQPPEGIDAIMARLGGQPQQVPMQIGHPFSAGEIIQPEAMPTTFMGRRGFAFGRKGY